MATESKEIKLLSIFAEEIRVQTIKQFCQLGFGHIGGAMSIIETLAVLYGKEMNINPKRPLWQDRDYLVMSKGHAGPALYSALALKGYFSLNQLKTLNKPRTNIPSHCDRNKTKGVDMTTGSLGQGVSTAMGIALGNKIDNKENFVYLIVGDGECDEGQVWEGLLFAAHNKLDNIILFIDNNKQQLDGYTENVLSLGDIYKKLDSFGWHTQKVDGHSIAEILFSVQEAKKIKGKPKAIILDTIKGKGCQLAEGVLYNHHMTFTKEQIMHSLQIAQSNLQKARAAVR